MCFVWIWEQTAIISLYSINWLVFITETECVYCAVRTGSLYIILRSAHTVYLCVLCGSESKQRLFPYTALTDWFLYPRRCVFTARYVLDFICVYIYIYNSGLFDWRRTNNVMSSRGKEDKMWRPLQTDTMMDAVRSFFVRNLLFQKLHRYSGHWRNSSQVKVHSGALK